MKELQENWVLNYKKDLIKKMFLETDTTELEVSLNFEDFDLIMGKLLDMFTIKRNTTKIPRTPIQSVLGVCISSIRKKDKSIGIEHFINPGLMVLRSLEKYGLFTIELTANNKLVCTCLVDIPLSVAEHMKKNRLLLPEKTPYVTDKSLLRKPVDDLDVPEPHHNKAFLDYLNSIGFKIDLEVLNYFKNDMDFNKQISSYIDLSRFYNFIDYVGDSTFYYRWLYDNGGRSYPRAYEVSLQGTKESKALLLTEKESVLTEEALPGLVYALSETFGVEGNLDDREEWFKDEFYYLLTYSDLDEEVLLATFSRASDNPLTAYKLLKAIRAIFMEGSCTTGLTMELDASSSGLQIMSILSNDITGLEMTNLLGSDTPIKLYKRVLDLINEELDNEDKIKDKCYPGTSIVEFTALKLIKKAVMTHYYNSVKTPEKLLSETQLKVFYRLINNLLPNCEALLEDLNSLFNPNALFHSWSLPDGHEALVYNEETVTVNDVRVHPDVSTTFDYSFSKILPTSNYRGLAPRIIHSCDSYIVRMVVLGLKKLGIICTHIHDCFVFSPLYYEEVISVYHKVLRDLLHSTIYEDIRACLGGGSTDKFDISSELRQEIGEAIEKSRYGIN